MWLDGSRDPQENALQGLTSPDGIGNSLCTKSSTEMQGILPPLQHQFEDLLLLLLGLFFFFVGLF